MSRNKRNTQSPKPIASIPAEPQKETTTAPSVVVIDQTTEPTNESITVATTDVPEVTVVEETVTDVPNEVLTVQTPSDVASNAIVNEVPLTQEQRAARQHAASVKDALEQYVRTLDGKIVISPETLRTAGRLMYRAVSFLLKFPEDEVLDVFWKFHLEYRDTLMRENVALRGINHLHRHESDVVTVVYTAFRVKMTNDTNPIDWNRVEELTKTSAIRVYLQGKKTPR